MFKKWLKYLVLSKSPSRSLKYPVHRCSRNIRYFSLLYYKYDTEFILYLSKFFPRQTNSVFSRRNAEYVILHREWNEKTSTGKDFLKFINFHAKRSYESNFDQKLLQINKGNENLKLAQIFGFQWWTSDLTRFTNIEFPELTAFSLCWKCNHNTG